MEIVQMCRGAGKSTTIRKKALEDMRVFEDTNILPIVLVADHHRRKYWIDDEVLESGLASYIHVRPKDKDDIGFFLKMICNQRNYLGIAKGFRIYIDDALAHLTTLEAIQYYVHFSYLAERYKFTLEVYDTFQ